jgi:sulfur carrier protein ThiS
MIDGSPTMDTATLTYHGATWQVPAGGTIRQAIVSVGLDPLQVLAIRNKKLISTDLPLEPNDEIKIVNVVGGG